MAGFWKPLDGAVLWPSTGLLHPLALLLPAVLILAAETFEYRAAREWLCSACCSCLFVCWFALLDFLFGAGSNKWVTASG